MSAYQDQLRAIILALGLKRTVAEVYRAAAIADDKTVGQVVAHFNNGGVTDICLNNFKVTGGK